MAESNLNIIIYHCQFGLKTEVVRMIISADKYDTHQQQKYEPKLAYYLVPFPAPPPSLALLEYTLSNLCWQQLFSSLLCAEPSNSTVNKIIA